MMIVYLVGCRFISFLDLQRRAQFIDRVKMQKQHHHFFLMLALINQNKLLKTFRWIFVCSHGLLSNLISSNPHLYYHAQAAKRDARGYSTAEGD